jgi:hypothetical protein
VVVAPTFSRLECEWEFCQPSDPFLSAQRDWLWAGFGAVIGHGLLQRRIPNRRAVPRGIGQEVAERDGTTRRHSVIECCCWAGQHAAIGKLWQPLLHTLVES